MYKRYQAAELAPLVISLLLLLSGICCPAKVYLLRIGIFLLLWTAGAVLCVFASRIPDKIVVMLMCYLALLAYSWGTIIQLHQAEILQFPFCSNRIHTITGTIRTDATINENTTTICSVAVDSAGSWRKDCGTAHGNISVFVKADPKDLVANQEIIATGTLYEIDDTFLFFADHIETLPVKSLMGKTWIIFRIHTIENLQQRLNALKFETNELCSGLLLGKYSPGAPLRNKAILSGCAHILALSGMHLHVLISVFAFFLRRFRRRWLVSLFSVCFSVVYVGIIGPKPSLIRACIMVVLSTLVMRLPSKSLITCSLLLHALVAPKSLISVGSVLSYYALFGIVCGTQPLASRLSILLPRKIALVVATTCSASFFTAPLSFLLFGSWRIIGLLLSPLIAPLAMIILLGTFLYVLVPCTIVEKGLDQTAQVFLRIIQWGENWSLAHEHLNQVRVLIIGVVVLLTVVGFLQYASLVERKRSLRSYDMGFSLRFPTGDCKSSL